MKYLLIVFSFLFCPFLKAHPIIIVVAGQAEQEIEVGSVITTAHQLNIRDDSPNQLIGNTFNEIVAKTQAGDTFKTVRWRKTPDFHVNRWDIWNQVEGVTLQGYNCDRGDNQCWIYLGEEQDGIVSDSNFSLVQAEKNN